MTCRTAISQRLGRFLRKEDGSLVEFAIVMALFLFFVFALIDFGRLAFRFVVADKAMQIAARIATVRPPACPGVPDFNARGSSITVPPHRFGTSCGAEAGVCANPGTISCTGSATNATAAEVWSVIEGAMPADATIANLLFRYDFDSDLGFLGGPYVPVVTVEVQNLDFQFVHPLAGLLAMTGSTASGGWGGTIPFPTMSTSLPGEDLNIGTSG